MLSLKSNTRLESLWTFCHKRGYDIRGKLSSLLNFVNKIILVTL